MESSGCKASLSGMRLHNKQLIIISTNEKYSRLCWPKATLLDILELLKMNYLLRFIFVSFSMWTFFASSAFQYKVFTGIQLANVRIIFECNVRCHHEIL